MSTTNEITPLNPLNPFTLHAPLNPSPINACRQRAARLVLFNLSRKKAAHLLQNAYRLSVQIKRCRHQRQKILAAAGVIQQGGRGWVARRVVKKRRETRRRDRAAAILQRAIQRYLRKLVEHRRKIAAALTLCKFVGGLSVKLLRMRRRRKSLSATRIQSVFRRHRARLWVSVLRADQRAFAAATRIQAVTRGNNSRVRSRALLHERRRGCAAATRIQAGFRGHRSRTHARALREQRGECVAATRIQAVFKGYRCRVHTKSLQDKRRACAVKIQGFLLQHVRTSRLQRERSALRLQRASSNKSSASGDQKLPQNDPTTASKGFDQRGSSQETPSFSQPRRTSDRTNLQLAIEALANGISRRNVLTSLEARDLKETLALPEGDPGLETVLRHRLFGIEVALDGPIGGGGGTSKPTVRPTVDMVVVKGALRSSLESLERGLRRPSE